MSNARRPVKRPDGGFSVEISLSTSADDVSRLSQHVQTWLTEVWLPAHGSWQRTWRTGRSLSQTCPETLYYNEDFAGPPSLRPGPNSQILMTINGRGSAKFWRDWLVSKILPDIKAKFPDVGDVVSIKNIERTLLAQ